ncbi:hypothetical protein BDA99DRAFT_574982 [Phascolomyces articulosus]|uniref:F-box domain-containing protein n=1 Tax=Phascolomyces articulosus TaxID=60185 RepID=A0AAD5PAA5_9FUNG|nr:hypothetical protein BDA99DRAFT_574982 [Phascolomyces articulosus]
MLAQQEASRIDFVKLLPIELLSPIFKNIVDSEYHDCTTIGNCLMVSSTWRFHILKSCSTIWQAVHVGEKNTRGSHRVCSIMPQVMHWVEDLNLLCSFQPMLSRYYELLNNGDFTSLKSLSLKGQATLVMHGERYSVLQKLVKNNHTINSLCIESNSDHYHALLSNILLICSRITHLVFKAKTSVSIGYLPLHFRSCLVSLHLEAPNILHDQLEWMIGMCPNLRYLSINKIVDNATLASLRQQAPHLHSVSYNMGRLDHIIKKHRQKNVMENSKKRKDGLRHFYIGSDESLGPYSFDVDEMKAYIDTHCETLQELRINFPSNGPSYTIQSQHQLQLVNSNENDIIYSQLLSLDCCDLVIHRNDRFNYNALVADIIEHSPILERLTLDYLYFPSTLFYAFAHKENHSRKNSLRELVLKRMTFTSRSTYAFEAFVKAQTNQPTLETIVLDACPNFSDERLVDLVEIPTLCKLVMKDQYSLTTSGLCDMANKAAMHHSLQVIKIKGLSTNTLDFKSVLTELANVKSLVHVEVDPSYDDPYPLMSGPFFSNLMLGMQKLVDTSNSIRVIHIKGYAMKHWAYQHREMTLLLKTRAHAKSITINGLE